ncbi:MAG TPA: ParB/RepB/Spo0J family partition protein [Synergistales bacterium]|nr:ParB/RepB/Spo0J family partition protein [Synergistaceae bacterium]HOO86087.1 ParB/RepB/Spo0J family partition protein [Synergistales bacterium]HRV97116.1 ParB/RepB/Spo0J family partition protein [Aminobacteriaceae bacterium]MDD3916085.1 ParB/RepB/Spo0J family partition protein [Synergistaceae bacterium]NLD97341.1 ParB/RepB/Spo0J family partition protein [Synergistaceae bacterium]
MAKGRGLGKGLASLLPAAQTLGEGEPEITMLSMDRILANPFQPRKEINENTLVELADSIRAHGVIQPLIVRRNEDGDYWIVAGERRWRAAKIVGLSEVPVRVIDGNEMEMREITLIENIQREDLSPVDTALALEELLNVYDITQDELAASIGWSRTSVTNKLRLLQLPEEVKTLLSNNELSEGHCRALLPLESQDEIAKLASDAVNAGLSVRQVEDIVKRKNAHSPKEKRPKDVFALPESISQKARSLGFSIRITGKKSKMKLHIEGVHEELVRDVLTYLEENAEKYFPGNTPDEQ